MRHFVRSVVAALQESGAVPDAAGATPAAGRKRSTNGGAQPDSRRELLLGAGAVLSALWVGAEEARAGTQLSDARWLANRISFGPTAAELALADSLGYEGYLEYQLNYAAIDDSALETRLATYTTLTMQPFELIPVNAGQIRNELTEAVILRAVFSKRQLYERMVEFWTDHFNIDIANDADQYLKTVDDRDVIRPNALGNFPALLSASAHSPAMLYYLNNVTSVAGNPNENYARELLELHTMGVTGGYTQADVVAVARCFTGWTMWNSTASPQEVRYTFRFNAGAHDNAAKLVLGTGIPAGGGQNDVAIVLGLLTAHPSTAQFLAKKLCVRFYSDDPPQSLIDTVAAAYTAHNGDIKEMLRALFLNIDPQTAPKKYKRPFHLMMSALRQSLATITSTTSIRTQLQLAGHSPYRWSPPDGYPDKLDAWVGLILPRWNFGASLLNNNISGAAVTTGTLLPGATTADQVVDAIDTALFGGGMSQSERDRIRTYLLPNNPSDTKKREAVGLAIASPTFQWH